MMRLVELVLATGCVILLVTCAAVNQQKQEPPRADDLHFHNLQVLPQNISRDDLIMTMRRFKQALGVECNHCHARMPGDPTKLDFRSDAKPTKNAARIMMRMTDNINSRYVGRIEEAYTRVSCWTCHRGKTQPDVVPSLTAEEPR